MKITLILAALLLAACGDVSKPEPTPKGGVLIEQRSGVSDALIPVTMPDGTRCVFVQPYRFDAGRAIACDFSKGAAK